jgi:thermostable 8-oxoguanine DNA glycosylase
MVNTIADFGNSCSLTNKDLEYSNYRHGYERKLVGIKNPLERDSLFPVFEYVMLSAAQDTNRLVRVFDRLSKNRLNTPEGIKQADQTRIREILKGTRFPNKKTENFIKLPDWWGQETSKDIVDEIAQNINSHEKRKQVYLRNKLAENGPTGIGYKISSLFIQTLTEDLKDVEVVTVDKWILEFLKNIGYDVKVPDYRTVSGITRKEYLDCERIISEKAEKCALSPGELGYALWCKFSYTKPDKGLFDFF